jgi:hypothetical protein
VAGNIHSALGTRSQIDVGRLAREFDSRLIDIAKFVAEGHEDEAEWLGFGSFSAHQTFLVFNSQYTF